MVSHLADSLVERYAKDATRVLDPFCGSGAVLAAAHGRGIPVSGVDINPLAALFTNVKLNGFNKSKAIQLAEEIVDSAKAVRKSWSMGWPAKDYWFTPVTIEKLERLRAVMRTREMLKTHKGIAVLLSFVLAIRLCSRADQRSPKPFISKTARSIRRGRHFDPFTAMLSLLEDLAELYGHRRKKVDSQFFLADLAHDSDISSRLGLHSHVITSPPYINAQDYFRNFKLELHVLEGVLPFAVDHVRERFIGTERGNLLAGLSPDRLEFNRSIDPAIRRLEQSDPRLAQVVHRYLCDMSTSIEVMKRCLPKNGRLILVCGDNLVGGLRIRTWKLLRKIIEDHGFALFDMFADRIQDRLLPPQRSGHKGLIKEEVICAFKRA